MGRVRWGLALALCLIVGCSDQEVISRVQPNALSKGVFDGEWYYLQTVIDTPASVGYTFVGEQGPLHKLRWDIQEHYLLARRSYDYIREGEPQGVGEQNDAANAVVAKFRIQSHFDIRREYNPVTGEEQNLLVENSVDRPWHQRDFMRVDWSENLTTDNEFLLGARLFDGIEVESAIYDQDATSFERNADGEVHYMDVVSKWLVKPTTAYLEDFGELPTCYLSYRASEDCAPGQITVRNSFLRVDNRDYEPMVYTGDRMDRFGYFVTERVGFNEDYGLLESERLRFVNRHNLWVQSHVRTAEGTLAGCRSDADCSSERGSRCDLALGAAFAHRDDQGRAVGACTVPYRDREVRPIVYYLSANTPEDLVRDAPAISREWNKAFVETVSSLRENECLAHGGDAASCQAERQRQDHQQMFVVCPTPVADDAPTVCGPAGLTPAIGDLRYHQLVYVNTPEGGSPLGYGPSAADPQSGEIIMGNAFLYGASMDNAASYARDIVALLNGDLEVASVQSGSHIAQWAAGQAAADAQGPRHVIHMDPSMLQEQVASMDFGWAHPDHAHAAPRGPAEVLRALHDARDELWKAGAFGDGTGEGHSRLQSLVGTDVERRMVTADARLSAGLDPFGNHLDDAVLEAASPLRGGVMSGDSALQRARRRMQVEVGCLDADFHDEGLLGLARAIKNAPAAADGTIEWYGQTYALYNEDGRVDYGAVRDMLRHPMFHGLALHEIGHSIGLRHNFSGSYDALNYRARYWELRDDGSMAPRLWDPITEEEREGRIHEHAYSTVMDYGNNFVVTTAEGIGHYDAAAIKMGYGDLVEVFEDVPNPQVVGQVAFIQQLGYPIMLDLNATGGVSAYNYTQWPELVGGLQSMQQRVDVPYAALEPLPALGSEIDTPLVDGQGRPAVPYLFCSDEQADLNPDCLRYDSGADAYESIQSVIDSYWNYYPFTNFSRGRVGFDVSQAVSRIDGRYFRKLKYANQIYGLYRGIFSNTFSVPQDDSFWTDPQGMGAWSAASLAAFRLLTRVVAAPEPGEYRSTVLPGGGTVLSPGRGSRFQVPEAEIGSLDGRYLETRWNQDAGYYWFDQLERVGYFYDKVAALRTLVDPTTNFLGRDTDADIRTYQINFGRTLAPALHAFFRGLLSEDWASFAPRVVGDSVTYPAPDEIIKSSMAGTPVNPNASFSIQLHAAVYGLALIPQTYDQEFLNGARLWLQGGAEEIDVQRPLVTFTDPQSGKTYAAASYPDAAGVEQGVAAASLGHAQALLAASIGPDGEYGTQDDVRAPADALQAYMDNLDILRKLTWEYGFGAEP